MRLQVHLVPALVILALIVAPTCGLSACGDSGDGATGGTGDLPDAAPGAADTDDSGGASTGDPTDMMPDVAPPDDVEQPLDVGPDVSAPLDVTDAADAAETDAGGDPIDEPDVEPALPCTTDLECVDAIAPAQCLTAVCNKVAKECVWVNAPVATPCQSGNPCKSGEVCNNGACIGGNIKVCDDLDPCTKDFCDFELGGCASEPWPNCCPSYDCEGKACGDDGCGGSCGDCGDLFCVGTQCVDCVPSCVGYQCGPDGCGGSCGACGQNAVCDSHGLCKPCTPECLGKSCGPNGCGGVCGVCPDDWFCSDDGLCVDCLAECAGKECGSDGCGGLCGFCEFGQTCNADGSCPPCIPECAGKVCGDDGCGGSCGECPGEGTCNAGSGQCLCEPDCGSSVCGDDGCGGSCGLCPGQNQLCSNGHCLVPSPGDHCVNPIKVQALPYHSNNNTASFANHYSMPLNACPGVDGPSGGKSRDLIYQFDPPTTGNYQISLEADTGFDTVLYIVEDCESVATSCVAGKNVSGGVETVVLWLDSDRSYFIVVDGFPNDKATAGKYWLDVLNFVNPGCDAECAGKSCGPDGCGGQCGQCDFGTSCISGACQPPAPGDTCAAPYVVDQIPYAAQGDTSGAGSDYHHPADACEGVDSGWGKDFADQVYVIKPPQGASYHVVLTPHDYWDATLYVVSDCADIADSCIAASENIFGGVQATETLDVVLAGGLTYYVIVDGASNLGAASGAYTLEVTKN